MNNQISGRLYDGKTARAVQVVLRLDEQKFIHFEPAVMEPQPLATTQIASRVGNVARAIRFTSGAVVESTDHDTLDAWGSANNRCVNLAHRLENKIAHAIGALVIVAVIFIAGAFWGIPRAADEIAAYVPMSITSKLGTGTLEAMDGVFFSESQLSPEQQKQTTDLFTTLLPKATPDSQFAIVFRDAGMPNAFALPDGTVVVTDELVELADNDAEIASVLLHEIGHVTGRHSLRMVISHAGLAGLALAVFGDVSSAGGILLGMPSVMMEMSYSRELEWEADTYALDAMKERGLAPAVFADFMERMEMEMALTKSTEGEPAGECPTGNEDAQADTTVAESANSEAVPATDSVADVETEMTENETTETEPDYEGIARNNIEKWATYLSTHPATAERTARFRNASPVK